MVDCEPFYFRISHDRSNSDVLPLSPSPLPPPSPLCISAVEG